MIRLMFITPYLMDSQIKKILSKYPCDERLEFRSAIYNCIDVESYVPDWPCDAIIARGYTADVLQARTFPFPVIKMDFTSADAIAAIAECKNIFSPKKVAVVCHPSLALATEMINKIAGIDVEIYSLDSPSANTAEVVQQAADNGCDLIIGGGTAYEAALAKNINTYLVFSVDETLWDAVDKAVKSVTIQRQEREKNATLYTLMDTISEGLILIDENNTISICNQFARRAVSEFGANCVGKDFTAIVPEFTNQLKQTQTTLAPVKNEILKRGETLYSASFSPVIVDNYLRSVLFTLTDISRVQEMEAQIRNRLHAKGMVTKYSFTDIICRSPKMRSAIETAKKFSLVDSNILIEGATGTGKELFAQSIHRHSNRHDQPFVAVNCAALPEQLLESELFGYLDGAFTGAVKGGKQGLFELAHNGTLFLDEIAELPLAVQGKLLRALQEHEIRRIGDNRLIPVNVRVIAATNRDLRLLAEQGVFRQDLYYRLDILKIAIPPLRERPEDVLPLFSAFLSRYASKFSKPVPELPLACEALLTARAWEGNVRELRNIAERFMVLYEAGAGDDPVAVLGGLLTHTAPAPRLAASQPHAEREKNRIAAALSSSSSREEAASMLRMSRSTLWRKMKSYRLI
ncbi:sigma 54-interacting transcriptional regulator [Desulfovibrio sp. OttesenSCG-928-O18]|nr:sigma 54-interacting transcriptional regulator [Desulfovibrio sp. OttesenSCG-928-O18]